MQPQLDPELCSFTNDYAPFGSDEGADVRHAYCRWQEAGRPVAEFLADWFRRQQLPESRFAELTEEGLAERLARDAAEPLWCDYADISLAFCRLFFESRLAAAERDRALRALDRQEWECVLEWQGWSDATYRLVMLAKMRKALRAAEVEAEPGAAPDPAA